MLKKADEVDELVNQLMGPGDDNNNPKIKTPGISGNYQYPVKVGQNGKDIDENNKPWIVGTFIPHQYVNETHPEGHLGLDLKAPRGTPIFPTGPGKVLNTSPNPKGGNTVKISHENGIMTSYYAHMDSIAVSSGQDVKPDTILGTVGDSGNAKGRGCHCHFEIKINGTNVDPTSIIGKPFGFLIKKVSFLRSLYELCKQAGELG